METINVSLDLLGKILNLSTTEMQSKYFTKDDDNGHILKSQTEIDSQFGTDISKHVELQRSAKETDGTRAGKKIAFQEIESFLEEKFGVKATGVPGGWKTQVNSAVDTAKNIDDIPSDEKIMKSQVYLDLQSSMQGKIDQATKDLNTYKEEQRQSSISSARNSLIESIISDSELNLDVHSGDTEDDKTRRADHIKAFSLLLQSEGITLEPNPDSPDQLIPMKDGKQLENDQYHKVTGKNFVSQKALTFFGQKSGQREAPPMGEKPGATGEGDGSNKADFSGIVDLKTYNEALDKAIEADKPSEYLNSMETHYNGLAK